MKIFCVRHYATDPPPLLRHWLYTTC